MNPRARAIKPVQTRPSLPRVGWWLSSPWSPVFASGMSDFFRVFQVEPLFSRQLLYYTQQVGGHYYRNYEHAGVTEHISPSEDYQRAITHHHSSSLQEWPRQEPETVEQSKKYGLTLQKDEQGSTKWSIYVVRTFVSACLYDFIASWGFYNEYLCKTKQAA